MSPLKTVRTSAGYLDPQFPRNEQAQQCLEPVPSNNPKKHSDPVATVLARHKLQFKF